MPRMKLQKNYGLTTALTLGIGTMIGAGIFILPSMAAGRAGPAAILAYLLGGSIALLTAVSLSELATGMPRSGGSYYFVNRSLGPFFGTVTGLGMWVGLIFASAFYMIGFEYYLSNLVRLGISLGPLTIGNRFVALLVTGLLILMNLRGTRGAGNFQNIIVFLLLGILLLFALGGGITLRMGGHEDRLQPFAPHGWGPVVGVASLVFIGFMGFEVVATVAGEIRDPGRTLWRAMLGSVAVVTILYMVIVAVAIGLSPPSDGLSSSGVLSRESTPISFAAEQFLGGPGVFLITMAAILATLSSANASILSASRISLAMGEDRILHPWTCRLHPVYGTPANAIVLTGGFILIFLGTGRVEFLAEIAGFMFLLTFILVQFCVIILRRTKPEWYRPTFTSPLFPHLQYAGALLCLILMAFMSRATVMAGLGMVGISAGWYVLWSRRQSRVVGEVKKVYLDRRIEEARAVIRDRDGGGEPGRILVPVSHAGHEPLKMRLAAALATERGTLIRLNVVVVPDQTPYESALDHIPAGTQEIMEIIRKHDEAIPGERVYHQIFGRSVPFTIVEVARQETCGLILISRWRARVPVARIRETFTNVVLHRARTDVAVLVLSEEVRARIGTGKRTRIGKIMVPFDENPHTVLALEFARSISRAEGASVTLFMVSLKKNLKESEARMHRILEELPGEETGIEPRIVVGRSPTREILTASAEYDLIIMGASRRWVLDRFMFGSIPDRVAAEAHCPVLVAKKWERIALSHVKGHL